MGKVHDTKEDSMSSRTHILLGLLKTARPKQWIKNLSVYAALVFSGFLFFVPESGGYPYFLTVSWAFVIFCLLSSSVYFFNDVIDYPADKKHPFKSKRPIASDLISRKLGLLSSLVLIAIAILLLRPLPTYFQGLCFMYLGLQWLYSVKLKHLPVIDLISIAGGFLIRVYAGAVVVNLHMSVWFLLTVVSASLFIAVAKRQSERTLLSNVAEKDLGSTRKSLKGYSQRLLDQYTGMFATATWLTYALFAFQHQTGRASDSLIASYYALLPRTWRSEKLLMLSIPFVIFAVMRYLQLVYEENKGESPTDVLLRDKTMLAAVLSFGIMVIVVLYGLS